MRLIKKTYLFPLQIGMPLANAFKICRLGNQTKSPPPPTGSFFIIFGLYCERNLSLLELDGSPFVILEAFL
jgi:hypothetical protein